MGILNIPEPFWHTTLLVKNRAEFERWLADPVNNESPAMFFLSSNQNGREEKLLTGDEIRRLTDAGFRQVKIGLNCILY